MKKRYLIILVFIVAISSTVAQIQIEIGDGMTLETAGGVSLSGISDITEATGGYYSGVIESAPLTNTTQFAGLTFSNGFTGIIKRTTGVSYSQGNGEGINFNRHYELNNTGGGALTDNLTVATVNSGSNDERNSLTGPFFLYTYNTEWNGNGYGSDGPNISANGVVMPIGVTDLVISEGVGVKVKIYLQGPYDILNGDMNTTINNIIPQTSPYSSDSRTALNIPSTAVDWILVELRDQTTSSTVIASRSAYLNSDGNLIDDNASQGRGIGIAAPPGDYYIVLKHRNHLAIMTQNVQTGLTWGTASSILTYDFTTGQTQAYGTNPMMNLGSGVYGMFTGDTDGSGTVNAADRSDTWNQRNLPGYYGTDVDLSGTVNAADRSAVWNNRNLSTQVPAPTDNPVIKVSKGGQENE